MPAWNRVVVVVSGFWLSGCATQTGAVTERAANEFRCDEDRVEVEDLGGNAYRVEACGETATYACVGGGFMSPSVTCVREGGSETFD